MPEFKKARKRLELGLYRAKNIFYLGLVYQYDKKTFILRIKMRKGF